MLIFLNSLLFAEFSKFFVCSEAPDRVPRPPGGRGRGGGGRGGRLREVPRVPNRGQDSQVNINPGFRKQPDPNHSRRKFMVLDE